VLALILGLALLAGGAYGAAYLTAGDKVPVGTTIAGVDVGGHDPTAAARVLRDGLSPKAAVPFTVVIGGRSQQVRPAQVGLAVDYDASVRKAGAVRSWRPSKLWRYFTDGTTYEPVVTLDQDRLAQLLHRLDATDGRVATDGAVVFGRHSFRVRTPRPGLTIDPHAAGAAFWSAFLSEDPSVDLTLSSVAPAVDAAAVHRFVRRFANPAMASPVELRFGSTRLHLSPADYGHLLVARRIGDRLRPAVQAGPLHRLVRAKLAGSTRDRPQPATVTLRRGHPYVVPDRPGLRFRSRDVAKALLQAITSPHRTARVRPTPARAAFTTADARRLGIRERLASFTAHLPDGAHAGRAAHLLTPLDGVLLRPGRSLSLRGRLGPAASADASDAIATALFNAAWLGGLQVPSHAPPRSYTGMAPPGRDISLDGGHDLVLRDDTRYGVLVSAAADHRDVTVTLWSTEHGTVTAHQGARTHVVRAGRQVRHSADCTPRAGQPGFTVTVSRTFSRDGAAARSSSYVVRYAPLPAIVCAGRHHRGHHHRQ
jgi:hypothetical protein